MRSFSVASQDNSPLYNSEYSSYQRFHPRGLCHRSILYRLVGALVLFLMGSVLLGIGLHWLYINHKGYIPFLSLGMLAFIPGTYGIYEVIL